MVEKEASTTPESELPQETPRSPGEVRALHSRIESALGKLESVINEIYEGPEGLASGKGYGGTPGYSAKVVSAESLMKQRRDLMVMGKMCQWFMGGENLPVDPQETESFIGEKKNAIRKAIEEDKEEGRAK